MPQKQVAGNRIGSTHPLFILSCERSGSTLLRYIVDTHPEIACQAGLNLGGLCAALFRSTFYSVGQVIAADETEGSSRSIERVRLFIGDLMAEYATAKGKRLWCDKTPANLQTLEILHAVFPDAKYICLYRNCMDVVHSCLEISRGNPGFMTEFAPYVCKRPDNLIAAMVDSWTDKMSTLLAFERANQAQCFRITYESLVLDTVPTLEAMFDFAGVGFDPQMLDAVFSVRHDEGIGDDRIRFSKEISKRSLGKGSNVSRAEIPADLLELMNTLLTQLDYPPVGPDWNTAPSPYAPPEIVADKTETVPTVEEIFAHHLPAMLKGKKDKAAELGGVCKFAVSGVGGGNWIVNLADQSIRKDRGEAKPDCVVAVTASDFIDVMTGKQNAMSAYVGGKVLITGDGTLANKIGMLLFGT